MYVVKNENISSNAVFSQWSFDVEGAKNEREYEKKAFYVSLSSHHSKR